MGHRRGSSSDGRINCQREGCKIKAKKSCLHQRCRTCCKRERLDCPTHEKSTWVPAAKRRERLKKEQESMQQNQQQPSLEGDQNFNRPGENPSSSSLPCFADFRLVGLSDEQYTYQIKLQIGVGLFEGSSCFKNAYASVTGGDGDTSASIANGSRHPSHHQQLPTHFTLMGVAAETSSPALTELDPSVYLNPLISESMPGEIVNQLEQLPIEEYITFANPLDAAAISGPPRNFTDHQPVITENVNVPPTAVYQHGDAQEPNLYSDGLGGLAGFRDGPSSNLNSNSFRVALEGQFPSSPSPKMIFEPCFSPAFDDHWWSSYASVYQSDPLEEYFSQIKTGAGSHEQNVAQNLASEYSSEETSLSSKSSAESSSHWNNQKNGFALDKAVRRDREKDSMNYSTDTLGISSDRNRGPGASKPKSENSAEDSSSSGIHKDVESASGIHLDTYNSPEFVTEYENAKFFVINSSSEDNVEKSIKHDIWASTPPGNRKLNAAYLEGNCPVFLFFSVNASGQFLGIAEMVGPVDFENDAEYWQQDGLSGQFPVKWHIIKDVADGCFCHILLENNDNKPVTHSQDPQEVKLDQGIEMLKIFKAYEADTSLLDDFTSDDDDDDEREKVLLEEKAKQEASAIGTPGVSIATAVNQLSDNLADTLNLEDNKKLPKSELE